jgi:hypothetical protein
MYMGSYLSLNCHPYDTCMYIYSADVPVSIHTPSEFVYPLEISVTVAKQFENSIVFEKCPVDAPVQKQTSPNLFSADDLRQ